MKVNIRADYAQLSIAVANAMIELVQEKPEAVFCLATGETPVGTYAALVQLARERQVDFSRAHFVGLDEWAGIPPSNPGSCRHFLQERVFQPLGIEARQIYLFDGMAGDLQGQCQKMNEHIDVLGGIDWMLVGIGMNGHIGFNEPGMSWDQRAHVATLAPITQTVGQKYFQGEMSLQQGLTLGMQQVMEARTVALLANGARKADIIQATLEQPISNELPATALRQHTNAFVFLDRDAAGKIDGKFFYRIGT